MNNGLYVVSMNVCNALLCVDVCVGGVLFNESAAWLYIVAHQHREYLIGLGSIFYGNLLQQTS